MAARIPEPEQTPQGPMYEGRPLARPDEDVVDQGASFDVRTVVSRRTVLSLVGAGIGGDGARSVLEWGANSAQPQPPPPQTAGGAASPPSASAPAPATVQAAASAAPVIWTDLSIRPAVGRARGGHRHDP